MKLSTADEAWNRFIANCFSDTHPHPDLQNAAIAGRFFCETGNGGLYGFLLCFPELDSTQSISALIATGAPIAAAQLQFLADGMGGSVPASSAEERDVWLEHHWSPDWDWQQETLTEAAETELTAALERHVAASLDYYLSLDDC